MRYLYEKFATEGVSAFQEILFHNDHLFAQFLTHNNKQKVKLFRDFQSLMTCEISHAWKVQWNFGHSLLPQPLYQKIARKQVIHIKWSIFCLQINTFL